MRDSGSTGAIFRFRVSEESIFDLSGDKNHVWSDLLTHGSSGKPILVVPPMWDERIRGQSANFVMTTLSGTLAESNIYTHQTYDSEVQLILISSVLKRQLREYLGKLGVDKRTLFPESIEAFSGRYAPNEPF